MRLLRARREGRTASQAEVSVLSKGRIPGDACEADAQESHTEPGRPTASVQPAVPDADEGNDVCPAGCGEGHMAELMHWAPGQLSTLSPFGPWKEDGEHMLPEQKNTQAFDIQAFLLLLLLLLFTPCQNYTKGAVIAPTKQGLGPWRMTL